MVSIDAAFDAFEEGDLKTAEELCKAILRREPEFPAAHYLLGTIFGSQERFEEAIGYLQTAQTLAPSHFATNVNLANLLNQTGRYSEALETLIKLESTNPLDPEALALKAAAFLGMEDALAAVETAERALQLQHGNIAAAVVKANALLALGATEAATLVYEKIDTQKNPILSVNKARILHQDGKLKEALLEYEQLLSLDAVKFDATLGKAQILCELDEAQYAAEFARAALTLSPYAREAKLTLAEAYRRMERVDEARKLLEELLTEKQEPHVLVPYAQVLSDLGHYTSAIDACSKAIQLNPSYQEAFLQRSLILLMLGDFLHGFEDYEHRLSVPYNIRSSLRYQKKWVTQTRVKPELPLFRNNRILIVEEQGIGDIIMFAGLLVDLLEYSNSFEVVIQKRLITLMKRSFPSIKFHLIEEINQIEFQSYDAVIMLGSLAHAFRHDKKRFRKKKYLFVDPQKTASWKAKLGDTKGKKIIGLSWTGGTPGTQQKRRSMPLAKFYPLLSWPNIKIVSLQFGETSQGRLPPEITSFSDAELNDIDDLASLLATLDIVVTVQNTNVHLAGALGKPCIVVVPSIAQWRYGHSRERMDWYESPIILRKSTDDKEFETNLVTTFHKLISSEE